MKKICYYIADDGTKFDEQFKCEEYEQKLKADSFYDTLECYDVDGKKLSLFDEEYVVDNVGCAIIKNKEAFDYFSNMLERLRVVDIDKFSYNKFPIAIYWDNETFQWELCESKVKHLKQYITHLQEQIDTCNWYIAKAKENDNE